MLPPAVKARLSVEAATRFGWERWVGDAGEAFGIDHFGASAPGNVVLEKFGFTPDNIAARAREVHERAGRRAGSLDDLPA